MEASWAQWVLGILITALLMVISALMSRMTKGQERMTSRLDKLAATVEQHDRELGILQASNVPMRLNDHDTRLGAMQEAARHHKDLTGAIMSSLKELTRDMSIIAQDVRSLSDRCVAMRGNKECS